MTVADSNSSLIEIGTEVEPAAGQALIDEFGRVLESPPEAETSPSKP